MADIILLPLAILFSVICRIIKFYSKNALSKTEMITRTIQKASMSFDITQRKMLLVTS